MRQTFAACLIRNGAISVPHVLIRNYAGSSSTIERLQSLIVSASRLQQLSGGMPADAHSYRQ
jgi:hypothetical protein